MSHMLHLEMVNNLNVKLNNSPCQCWNCHKRHWHQQKIFKDRLRRVPARTLHWMSKTRSSIFSSGSDPSSHSQQLRNPTSRWGKIIQDKGEALKFDWYKVCWALPSPAHSSHLRWTGSLICNCLHSVRLKLSRPAVAGFVSGSSRRRCGKYIPSGWRLDVTSNSSSDPNSF